MRRGQPPQQPSPTSVAPSKDLPPAHQASIPQAQVARATPVYNAGPFSAVPQVN